MPNELLEKYIKKRISEPTVILCFKILLENVIQNGANSGLTTAQISKLFALQTKSFGIQKFRTDYILRQRGNSDEYAISDEEGVYFIKEAFLKGLTKAELTDIINSIEHHYSEITKTRQQLYSEIFEAKKMAVDERRGFIIYMLMERETEKKGQSFEVTAFAILKVFYSIRGFELNRFSTIYSNDGGIDYTSQTSIYQVTTKLDDNKFKDDLNKAPLKKRIFVYRKAVAGFDFSKMESELVSDYISSEDLITHLDYLLSKKPAVNSGLVLDVILHEFEREHYL